MALYILGAWLLLTTIARALGHLLHYHRLPLMPTANPTARAEDFRVGQPIRYVPPHANGDGNHRDCQNGYVADINHATQTVFIRFSLGDTAAGCKPHQLI